MKKIIWILLALIILIGGYYLFKPKTNNTNYSNMEQNASSTNDIASTTKLDDTPALRIFTKIDVSSHSSSDSCWAIIEGKVYDLTSWIGKHPGGDKAILSICGKDGTEAFDGKHGMDPKAKAVLPKFYLGDLVN